MNQQSRTDDETKVLALYQQMIDGWNQGNAEAFTTPFAEDGDLIAFDGAHFKGRNEIVAFHQPLFDKWLKGTRLVAYTTSVRFLSPESH